MTDMGMGIVMGTNTCTHTCIRSTPTCIPNGLPLPMSNTMPNKGKRLDWTRPSNSSLKQAARIRS